MDSKTFYDLIGNYGLIAVFFLAMIEGDITLLLGGVLAHSGFFGDYSLLKVLCFGTLGGVVGDNIAYGMGRTFCNTVRNFRFYRMAQPRLERLTGKFGPLSIFLSKYVYGLRAASCVFWGVGRMRYLKFLPLTLASCFMWVLILSSAGYFFSGAITRFIGDFHQIGIYLLLLVVVAIGLFYLAETLWFSKKIEEADPALIQELEQAAQDKLQIFQERLTLKSANTGIAGSRKRKSTVAKQEEAEGD